MLKVNYYLIYQDSSVDEGSRTIIVGPFENKNDRQTVRNNHESNNGGCWSVGIYDWEFAGEVDGQVTHFPIESPHKLLN